MDREATPSPESDGDLTLAGGDASSSSAGRELARGSTVGRYVLLGRIGEGGMGVVYGAYDPELDRKVALKLLRGHRGRASTRALREAQALAKLSDPNVVGIYDVGTHGERVWLAMELVEGHTLKSWLTQRERPWKEVLEVMIPVGRGLAAAHAVGIVHRDVKPGNIMIGSDGRARVMDFGLARAELLEDREPEASVERAPSASSDEPEVTRVGALLGTPAYMAPEQHLGLSTDARTDQFAYCVTVWEALYRERPFHAETVALLALAVTEGKLRAPPRAAAVPTPLRRVVERGLAADPGRRWPSMDALLSALEREQARVGRGRIFVGLAVAAVAAAGAASYVRIDQERRRAACAEQAQSEALPWSDADKPALRSAMVATGAGWAATTFDKTVPWLDDYASAWRETHEDVCVRAEIEGTLSPELAAHARACLDERRESFVALLQTLAHPDLDALQLAVAAAAGLEPVRQCGDPDELARAHWPEDPALQAEVGALRRELAALSSLGAIAPADPIMAAAKDVLVRAEALGWVPLIAEAQLSVGTLLADDGRYDEAEHELEKSFAGATAAGIDSVAAEAAGELVVIVGVRLARPAEGLRWGRVASAMLQRAGRGDDGLQRTALLTGEGIIHYTRAEYDEAYSCFARVLEIHERVLGADHPTLATTLTHVGNVELARGNTREARDAFVRALALGEAALGGDHPDVGLTLHNLGNAEIDAGDVDAALAHYERALVIRERVLGPAHPELAPTIGSIGVVLRERGEYEQALIYLERALAIQSSALGPDHPDVALTLDSIGTTHKDRGEYQQALDYHERALAIFVRTGGEDSLEVARTLNSRSAVYSGLGRHDEAVADAERGLAIIEQTMGPDHRETALALRNLGHARLGLGRIAAARAAFARSLAIDEALVGPDALWGSYALMGLAACEVAEGRFADAIAPLERVRAIRVEQDAPAHERADVDFQLARALVGAGRERERAIGLAEAALASYRSRADAHARDADEVAAWLRGLR